MRFILQIFTLKRTLMLSAIVIALLVISNFYGPYTNKFYFFNPSNYIFPILSVGHLIFLYVLRFKIKEEEMTDPQMRNLEYVLYAILLVYAYKAFESIYVLSTYSDYGSHSLPMSFIPVGLLITVLYFLLIGLGLLVFKYRKDRVGPYKFDDMNHIDSWE